MIRTRHRLLAYLACVVAVGLAADASANGLVQLDYNAAKVLGDVHLANGAIDITNGAMIVTTSSFGFVPQGTGANEYMTNGVGVPEYGDAAIHDALAEGSNYGGGGFWNGTNGITSSSAANDGSTSTTVNWLDNAYIGLTSFRGQPVDTSQSIIEYTYFGDADLSGTVDSSDYFLWSGSLGQSVGIYGQNGSTLTGSVAPYNNPGSPVSEGLESLDGDFDQSGSADSSDYFLWSATVGLPALYSPEAVVPSGQAAGGIPQSVPEPASLTMLISLALLCVGARFLRRRAR